MRRFRRGATNGPSMLRPGAGYGRLCFGAPGPTQEVDPREDLVPELFTGEPIRSKTKLYDYAQDDRDTIIDLTTE